MPLYEYECQECGQKTEVLQRFGEEPKATCDQCGGELRKLLSAPMVKFKGSGWYVTDYASKKPAANRSEGKGEAKPKSSSGEGAAAKKTGNGAKSD